MIKTKGLHKHFKDHTGKTVTVLNNINMSAKKGEFVTIFGPNGCGKSTLMNIIAGIEQPTHGTIEFKKSAIKIGYVFQDYRQSLLPWQNVWQNIAAPILWSGTNKTIAHKKTTDLLKKLKINLDLNAYPFMISGGQAQLVCILRSLIIDPDILILDEPFSALDYLNHLKLMIRLQNIQHNFKTTTLFISHNIDEALFLGDRLLIFSHKPAKIIKNLNIPIHKPRKKVIFIQDDFIKIKQKALAAINKIQVTD